MLCSKNGEDLTGGLQRSINLWRNKVLNYIISSRTEMNPCLQGQWDTDLATGYRALVATESRSYQARRQISWYMAFEFLNQVSRQNDLFKPTAILLDKKHGFLL